MRWNRWFEPLCILLVFVGVLFLFSTFTLRPRHVPVSDEAPIVAVDDWLPVWSLSPATSGPLVVCQKLEWAKPIPDCKQMKYSFSRDMISWVAIPYEEILVRTEMLLGEP